MLVWFKKKAKQKKHACLQIFHPLSGAIMDIKKRLINREISNDVINNWVLSFIFILKRMMYHFLIV